MIEASELLTALLIFVCISVFILFEWFFLRHLFVRRCNHCGSRALVRSRRLRFLRPLLVVYVCRECGGHPVRLLQF
jgi:DNA-directed RNA polymerase subunit RPC12/RpoP